MPERNAATKDGSRVGATGVIPAILDNRRERGSSVQKAEALHGGYLMNRGPRHIALMSEPQWPDNRHAEVYAGVPRYAEEWAWVTAINVLAADTLCRQQRTVDRYDGVVGRANRSRATRPRSAPWS